MFNQDEITLDDHLKYINSLKTRDDRLYFLVKKDTKAIGVIDFININIDEKTAEFGIYANPDLKGVGSMLMESIINYAFKELNLKTLKAEVFEENSAGIKLYNRYNFIKTGEKEFNNKKLVCMELNNENR